MFESTRLVFFDCAVGASGLVVIAVSSLLVTFSLELCQYHSK
jgi:hypothetical protein